MDDKFFDLEFSITNEFQKDAKEGKAGCINCLKNGRFEFWHDTEFGMLDEDGLTKVYKHNIDILPRSILIPNRVKKNSTNFNLAARILVDTL